MRFSWMNSTAVFSPPREGGSDGSNVDDSVAKSVVFENLDLDGSDLGVDINDGDDDTNDNNDNDGDLDDVNVDRSLDLPDDEVERQPKRQPSRQLDDLRVTHTRPLAKNAEVKSDGKGNLVNAQGQIVARAGKEARFYQDAHNAKQAHASLQTQYKGLEQRLNRAVEIAQGLHTEVERYKGQDKQFEQFGLKPAERMRAYQNFVELRDTPEQALRNLLTRAAAAGIDMTKLNVNGSPFDVKSLVDLVTTGVNEKLNPLIQRSDEAEKRQKEQNDAQEIQRRARAEVDDFLTSNPDEAEERRAALPVITQILGDPRAKGMRLEDIWVRIQLNRLRRGQDESRPQDRTRQRRGMLNGRRTTPNPDMSSELAPLDQSYDSILRDVMKDEGL